VIMAGGETFTGNSGTPYVAGRQETVGPADVRMALMLGWVQPDEPPAEAWSGANHPDMLTVELAAIKARLTALEALVKPGSVIA
jgi:hypothetical protein